MLGCPLWLGGGSRCGRGGRCRGGGCCGRARCLPWDGFYRRAGRQHLQLLEAIDHHLFACLEAVKNDPAVVLRGADLDGARGHLAVDEMLQAAADLFGHLLARLVIDEGLDGGLGDLAPLHQLADGRSGGGQRLRFQRDELSQYPQ